VPSCCFGDVPVRVGHTMTADGGHDSAIAAGRVRQANLSMVLRGVLDGAPISQAALGELTGLKKPTISKLVDGLHRAGWILPRGETQGATGRPRRLWAPDPGRGLVVGAQLSLEQIAVLVVDFASRVRAERSMRVDLKRWTEEEAIGALGTMVAGALDDVRLADGENLPVLGVALAAPGLVQESGSVAYVAGLDWAAPHLPAQLRTALAGTIGPEVPVVVENEANLATLAEQHYGHVRAANMVCVVAGRGVGAGVVVDGRLFRGAHRTAGEVGHVTLDLDGPPCPCGKRGCWAVFVGVDALRDHVLEAHRSGRASELVGRATRDGLTPEEVVRAAGRGDSVAREVVTRVRRYTAAGIGNLISVYDPELVVLGGFLRSFFADSLDELRSEVVAWTMGGRERQQVRVELSSLSDDAARWGGVRELLRRVTADPRTTPPD
jgi:predicted NBD/HSP70 family sugar kinase